MGRIKGAAIRARLEWLRERSGDAQFDRVVSRLSPVDRIVVASGLVPSAWYPFALLQSLDQSVVAALGGAESQGAPTVDPPDAEVAVLFEDAGDHVARQHARSIYRAFFRETEPLKVLRVARCVHAGYYSGLGRATASSSAVGAGRVQVEDAAATSRTECHATLGYFRRVLETCTGRAVIARELCCRSLGDATCEFEFRWSEDLATPRSSVVE